MIPMPPAMNTYRGDSARGSGSAGRGLGRLAGVQTIVHLARAAPARRVTKDTQPVAGVIRRVTAQGVLPGRRARLDQVHVGAGVPAGQCMVTGLVQA